MHERVLCRYGGAVEFGDDFLVVVATMAVMVVSMRQWWCQ